MSNTKDHIARIRLIDIKSLKHVTWATNMIINKFISKGYSKGDSGPIIKAVDGYFSEIDRMRRFHISFSIAMRTAKIIIKSRIDEYSKVTIKERQNSFKDHVSY